MKLATKKKVVSIDAPLSQINTMLFQLIRQLFVLHTVSGYVYYRPHGKISINSLNGLLQLDGVRLLS